MNRPVTTKETLLKWVDDQQQLDPRATLILLKLAAYADAECCAWAAISTLAYQSRSSERTVQYTLRKFEADGLIRRTDRKHRIIDTTRDVPIYQLAPEVAGLGLRQSIGAKSAPIPNDGCKLDRGMGAKGLHPHNEPTEQTLPSGSDTRAPEREALFVKLEAAYPKLGLGFTHRDRAWQAFSQLLDEGLDAGLLIQSAAAYAAHPGKKRLELGLDHWLVDRKFRGWWPEPQLALDEATVRPSEMPAHAAPAEDQGIWRVVAERLATTMLEGPFSSYVRPAVLSASGGVVYLVAATSIGRDWLRNNAARRIAEAWAEADAVGRPLHIVSKIEFEAALRRQPEGAMS